MSQRFLDLSLNLDELVEIDAALSTKINYVDIGRFGPEDKPGEDRRWMHDLRSIQKKVRAAIQQLQGGKQS